MYEEMNIEAAQYSNDRDGNQVNIKATIDGKDVWVPIETGNRHYDEIQRQVAAGDLTIADAD